MTRLITGAVLAAAALMPATAAHARCYGEPDDPRTTICSTTCRVYAELHLAYC